MVAFYILLAIAVIFSIAFIAVWSRERPLISFFIKGLATISIISLAIYTVSMYALNTITILLIVGLVFCLLGDLVLALLELCDSSKRSNIITYGIVSFMLAQVAFIVMFGLTDVVTLYGLIAGVVIAGIIFLLKKPMKLDFGANLVPGILYAALLGTNVASSIILMITSGFNVCYILLAVGFVSFIVSDLILSQIYFAGNQKPMVQKINYVFYYLAILLIGLSFVGI